MGSDNSSSATSSKKLMVTLLLIFTIFSLLYMVSSYEFEVGDHLGWVVPPPNDTKFYNDWASEKRFKPGDALRFKYRKDSVMEVSEAGYMQCNSTHPRFFSNNGNSILKLDGPGFFYFISGANAHCQKGQKMNVKVLSPEDDSGKAHHISSGSPPVLSPLGVLTSILPLLLYLTSSSLI